MSVMTRPKHKALLVGVVEYVEARNLLASKHDVEVFRDALQKYCFVPERSIESIAGCISRTRFDESFTAFCAQEAEIGIVFFSGHGRASGDGMAICFSDGRSESMRYVMREAAKNVDSLWVVVDACQSGGARPPRNDQTIDIAMPFGCGVTYFAACAADESAWAPGSNSPSNYTALLCMAMSAAYCKARGCTEMKKVERAIRLMMIRHNERDPMQMQHPVIRHEMIGAIVFRNPAFQAFEPPKVELFETRSFRLVDIKPCHTGLAQRNSVVVQTAFMDDGAIVAMLPEIIRFGRKNQVFESEMQERHYKGKPVDIVFIYVAHTDEDVIHCAYSHRAAWMRNDNPSFHWGEWVPEASCWLERIDYYEAMNRFISENLMSDEEALAAIRDLYHTTEALFKGVSHLADEYENGSIDEAGFLAALDVHVAEIREVDERASNIGFAGDEYDDLANLIMGLTGDLMCITVIYSQKGMEQRTVENRLACLRMYLDMYLDDSRRFKEGFAKVVN